MAFGKAGDSLGENAVRHLSFAQVKQTKGSGFDDDVFGVLVNHGGLAAHRAGESHWHIVAGNHNIGINQSDFGVVEQGEFFAFLSEAYTNFWLGRAAYGEEFIIVERVKRLAG